MKKVLLLFAAFSIASCTIAQEKQFSKEALAEKLVNVEGNTIQFQNIVNRHKGKTVLIEVWASWCGDCVKAMPLIKDTQTKNPDVDYVFISMDKVADKWKEGIDKHGLKGEHYWAVDGMKGAFGKAIDLDWIPRYIVINKKGEVVLYRAIESDFNKINEVLKSGVPAAKTKAGPATPVAKPVTPAPAAKPKSAKK